MRIHGRVQGVFFRAETQRRAASRGLGGWVANRPDGTVEAVFEGARDDVESMLRWCEQGPRHARVDELDVGWEEPLGEDGFGVR